MLCKKSNFDQLKIDLLLISRKGSNEICQFILYHFLLGISNYLQIITFLGFLVFEKKNRIRYSNLHDKILKSLTVLRLTFWVKNTCIIYTPWITNNIGSLLHPIRKPIRNIRPSENYINDTNYLRKPIQIILERNKPLQNDRNIL